MTGRVIPMRRLVGDERHGIVHVMQLEGGGYEVSHESASGDSWGNFSGRIDDAQRAIVVAHAMNRDQYGGRCAVSVCDAATADVPRPTPAPLTRGDF